MTRSAFGESIESVQRAERAAEETFDVEAFCESCEWIGLAEVFEGEFYDCPECGAGALVRR